MPMVKRQGRGVFFEKQGKYATNEEDKYNFTCLNVKM